MFPMSTSNGSSVKLGNNFPFIPNCLDILTFSELLLLLEQPINLSGGTIETTVSGLDVTGGEACYHEDTLGQV